MFEYMDEHTHIGRNIVAPIIIAIETAITIELDRVDIMFHIQVKRFIWMNVNILSEAVVQVNRFLYEKSIYLNVFEAIFTIDYKYICIDEIHLTPGTHQYTFQVLLPAGLPTSVEHSVGHITYSANVVLDIPVNMCFSFNFILFLILGFFIYIFVTFFFYLNRCGPTKSSKSILL